jgi:hypothetical protein
MHPAEDHFPIPFLGRRRASDYRTRSAAGCTTLPTSRARAVGGTASCDSSVGWSVRPSAQAASVKGGGKIYKLEKLLSSGNKTCSSGFRVLLGTPPSCRIELLIPASCIMSWAGCRTEKDILCKTYHISLAGLRYGSRRPVVVEACGWICWIAVRGLGYSGTDVARYLGVTNSGVTRFVASGKSLMLMTLLVMNALHECLPYLQIEQPVRRRFPRS